MTVHEFIGSLRAGPYAGPGGYPKIWVTDDGGVLCHGCCLAEALQIGRAIRDGSHCGWRVTVVGVHWEGPPEVCDLCGAEVESAYGDPEQHRRK